jgi:hypothetical protein
MQLDIDKSLEAVYNMFKGMDFDKIPQQESTQNPIPKQEPIQDAPKVMLDRAFETTKNVLGTEFFDISYDGSTITVKEKGCVDEDQEYPKIIASLLEFMISNGYNVQPIPEIKIIRDVEESKSFFGKTAYYDPSNMEIVLYIEGRHKKDVVRSFSHEMIHHMQNLEGRLGEVSTTNTNEDENLEELEKEAYLKGNMIFRSWEDSIKNKK